MNNAPTPATLHSRVGSRTTVYINTHPALVPNQRFNNPSFGFDPLPPPAGNLTEYEREIAKRPPFVYYCHVPRLSEC